jgi:hypothetical protein
MLKIERIGARLSGVLFWYGLCVLFLSAMILASAFISVLGGMSDTDPVPACFFFALTVVVWGLIKEMRSGEADRALAAISILCFALFWISCLNSRGYNPVMSAHTLPGIIKNYFFVCWSLFAVSFSALALFRARPGLRRNR